MANRFWVGGSGTWDNSSTANWAATTGGASGASAPTGADSAIFDTNSGTAATVTVASTAVALTTNLNKSDLTLSLAGNATLATFASPTAFTFTSGAIVLNSYTLTTSAFISDTTSARSVDFGTGKIVITGNNAVVWRASQANFTASGSKIVELTYAGATGTRDIRHGYTVAYTEANSVNIKVIAGTDIVSLSNGGNSLVDIDLTGFAGSFNFGSGPTIYGNFNAGGATAFVSNTGTATFAATSGTKTIDTKGLTVNCPLTFNGVGGIWEFQGALTQLSTRAFTITNGTVRLKNGVTSTVGAFATTGTNQKFLQSTLAGSQATLSQASGTVSASNLTIQDINATGGATWNAYVTSNNINFGNNSGWDFYLPVNSIYDSLRLRGYTGTVTDMLLQYYKANGAVSNSLQDAESEFLILKGFTTGTNTDKWFNYLRSLSYTGSINDMLFDYWKDPA